MSEVKVNKISPRTNCGTVQLGDSGDTITIPAGATITNNGTQTGFGRTGTVDWDTTPKTASFTAVSGNGYFVNTTSGAITVTLPASPSAGDIVSVKDYAQTFQTNNCTLARNSSNIEGVAADQLLNGQAESVTFVYVDSTKGWLLINEATSIYGPSFVTATGGCITTCGDCKIHTFTGPGTFTVSTISSAPANNVVSYLVLAGGGGGGSDHGGGGGAGGFREYKSPVTPYTASPLDGNPGGTAVTVSAQAYPITVGGGGPKGAAPNGFATDGSNSVFSTITSTGGGAGGTQPEPAPNPGGSGGGGSYQAQNRTGGTGNTPPVTPSQGNDGGDGVGPNAPYHGGGGGGAAGAGSDAPSFNGAGGNGVATSITGSPVTRAGGGGAGGTSYGQSGGGGGGPGGGGPGSCGGPPGTDATANTGSGGGGGYAAPGTPGGNGSGGIVVIRYKFQ